MGLGSLVTRFSDRPIEYGSDGDWWRSMYTPWPGLINDSVTAPYVTASMAEGIPGIGRGVELISGVVSQLFPRLYLDAHQPNRPSVRLDTPPLLNNPDPNWHGLPEWLTAVVASLFWYGDAMAYRGAEVTDSRGWPLRLPLMDTTRFNWRDGRYEYTTDSGVDSYTPSEIAHFVLGARAGRRFGLGILDRYQTELKLMIATEEAQYVLMKDGKPMGILALGVDVNPDQAAQYKEGFLKAVRESGVAAIGNADFKPVQWSSADLSMIPTREFNLRLASDICGVPPYLLGVPSESRVYSNMENEWTTFVRVTLGRYLRAIESTMSSCFPRGQTVQFDLDQLLKSDTKTRYEVYTAALAAGILTLDEIRQSEDLPPLPEPKPMPAPNEDDDDEQDDDEEDQS